MLVRALVNPVVVIAARTAHNANYTQMPGFLHCMVLLVNQGTTGNVDNLPYLS